MCWHCCTTNNFFVPYTFPITFTHLPAVVGGSGVINAVSHYDSVTITGFEMTWNGFNSGPHWTSHQWVAVGY